MKKKKIQKVCKNIHLQNNLKRKLNALNKKIREQNIELDVSKRKIKVFIKWEEKRMSQSSSNIEAWRFYLSAINSPDSFINAGFYFMVSSALQRRVWLGSEERPLFPNMFIIPVGEPGIGKGMVINPMMDILRYHKLKRHGTVATDKNIITPEFIADHSEFSMGDIERKVISEPNLAIPMAPNCTTFEMLVRTHVKSTRRFNPSVPSTLAKNGIYAHSSLCFLLTEISSLFHKQADKIVVYLQDAYDCVDYDYETKHQGTDRIRKSCLNFFGGTTPQFMERALNSDLLAEGFASRVLFVFEHTNRSNAFRELKFSLEQLEAKQKVIDHIGELLKLFGQVEYTPEAREVFREYFEDVFPYERSNTSTKLNYYYARKNVHAQKLAMAIHFSESLSMEITESDAKMALIILEKLEEKMHFAITNKGSNPLSAAGKKIARFLNINGPTNFYDIWRELEGELKEQELTEVLRYLVATNQIAVEEVGDKKQRKWIGLIWKRKNQAKENLVELESKEDSAESVSS